jgi:dipeptidyl aminopeptidase/acylaminoacyl peptidase
LIYDSDGQPRAGAIALVATVRGQVYKARSDGRGRYRIDGVPPGHYVPLAAAWGYQETAGEPIQVATGRLTRDVNFTLAPYRPALVEPSDLRIGAPQEAASDFPSPLVASRFPFTFDVDGLTVDGGQLYLPPDASGPLPTLFMVYPSASLNWDATSVALTRDGFAVLAVGPDADRGLDIEGHVRNLRAAFQLWQEGRIWPVGSVASTADRERWVMMSGSFGSLVMFRALRDLPSVPAMVNVGGVSDAFLAVNSLYSEDLAIPPPYDTAVAALGRPDQDPAFFFAYSPVFFADRLPSTLIVHTYADEVISYNQATALDAAMTAAGVPHDLLLYEDTTHYLDAYNPTQATHTVYERVVAFAKEHTR